MATAFLPASTGLLERARGVLVAAAVVIVAVDSIGLGLDWANAVGNSATSATPRTQAKQTVPSPVVDSADNPLSSGSESGSRFGGGTASSPLVGPPVVTAPSGSSPSSPSAPGTTPAPAPAVPLAQVDAAVPMLGLQASLGLGDGGCTTVNLTVIALGDDCAPAPGDGPVVLRLGGSLLGS